ncbi:MAG: ABC transporter ATP-binding protein [Erysipelothrix sp.]|nr:ABC transporter ATP-binding protein [Erysipelothrix sp.]
MKKLHLGHKGWLLLNIIGMVLMTVFNGFNIYLLRIITDYGLNKQIELMLETARWIILLLLLGLVVDLVGTYLRSQYIEQSLLLMKRHYVYSLLNQDITQLQKEKVSVYRSNLTNDFDRFQDKYLLNILQLIRMTLQFVMAVILVSTVSPYLVVVAFILLILFLVITSNNSKPVQKSEAKKSASLQKYTSFVEETLQGFDIIKQHQLKSQRHELFLSHAVAVQKDNYGVDVKETQVAALNQFIQSFILFGLVVSGILFARSTNAGLGSIILVASAFGNVMWPLSQFSPVITQMKGIVKVLDEFDLNLKVPVLNRSLHVDHFETLAFNQADLGYEDEEKSILTDVNLSINVNEKVLIVGRSGAGKSTILKTIRQNIVPKGGLVSLNRDDIFSMIPIDYYSLFTTVDQIGFIFSGSVKDNLTLYQSISDEKCRQALHQVGLSQLNLDDELVNNGSNVSGGQRARLMLARALCLETSVILCDEIFASLELEIAQSIEKDLLSLPKTIINVSHIIFKEHLELYDKIYVVDEGKLTQVNAHQDVWDRMILSQT